MLGTNYARKVLGTSEVCGPLVWFFQRFCELFDLRFQSSESLILGVHAGS